jgi:hypothetical protein
LGALDPQGIVRIRSAGERAAGDLTQVVDDHVMEFDAAVSVSRDTVEHIDDVADLNVEAGFLANFPNHGRVQFFARFDHSPR